jgi:radical SAM superfamily enzyme YgiQ (UPF0313 family)
VASYLEKNGFDVKIIDCSLGKSHEELINILKKEKPDLVGITSTTPVYESALKVAKNVKRELPETVVVIGGSHVTALPEEVMKTGFFDFGVLGEGELTIVELCKELDKYDGKNVKKVKGLVYNKGKGVHFTGKREFVKNLDDLPFPAWHLLPKLSEYSPTPASYKKLPQGIIMTTRGCPFQCKFCDNAVFGCSYRERSAYNVLDEIGLLVEKFGMKDLKFFDDTLTVNKKRLYEICNGIKERGYDFEWCCLTRVDNVSEEMFRKMKDSGCWQVLFGIESGDPKVLKNMKKDITIEQASRAVKLAKSAGLVTRCDFLFGTPGETSESMKRTLEFAKKLNPDFAHFNKFTPYPGSEFYRMLVRQGYEFDFSKKCSQLDHSLVMYVPDGIKKEEYSKFIDDAHKEFYMRPSYILRSLSRIKSFEDFKRMVRGFWAVYKL